MSLIDKIRYCVKFPLVIPHLIVFLISKSKQKDRVKEDIEYMNLRCKKKRGLSYYLIDRKPYRNLFYYRMPQTRFFKLFLPQYELFTIAPNCDIAGGAFVLNHPYATIINAKSIGKNLTICHLTTIGNGQHANNELRPRLGDYVSIGANANIIGNITIGNNVVIGAGSVVVKDIPDNCVVAGNPAKIIRNIKDI